MNQQFITDSDRRRARGGKHILLASLALALMATLVLWSLAPGGVTGQQKSPWEEGVHVYQKGKCADGYTLFLYPPTSAVLLDMNGNKVREWNPPGGCGYLVKAMPGGNILTQGANKSPNGEYTDLIQLDWSGDRTWGFNNWTTINGVRSAETHHDFEREGNPVGYYAPGQDPKVTGGRTLVLAHTRVINYAVSWWQLLDPVIYEVDWNGYKTWEWHGIDHFPEMGFNDLAKAFVFWLGGLFGDYLHVNSVSTLGQNKWYDGGDARFHPDNIIVSCRSANLVFIIERATGKIVYRVGPDYSPATAEGRNLGQIVGQHHAHMIPEGLPGEGNILLFDNGGFAGYPLTNRPYSRILEFNPTTYELVWKYEKPTGIYWIPAGPDHMFYSFYISGAQRLPNGNTLVTEGSCGRIFEVSPDNEIVWEYSLGSFRSIYRAYRVPPEWVPGNPSGYPVWATP